MAGTNAKSAAWDIMGNRFWTEIDEGGRPSEREVDLYLEGADSRTRVCVVGASTYFLIKRALEIGAHVTVVDFSAKMCSDLIAATGRRANVVQHNILLAVPTTLIGKYDFVISDRIANRFTHSEFSNAAKTMASFVASGGVLRLGVKLGIETIDEQLMATARERNVDIETF